MKRSLFSLIILSTLISCGGGGGGGGTAPASKNLFSLWKNTTTNAPMDLTGGSFGAPIGMYFFFSGGAQCRCTMNAIGDQSSGSWALSSCYYVVGSGASDPGCTSLNDTGTYTLSNNTLSICSGTTHICNTYR